MMNDKDKPQVGKNKEDQDYADLATQFGQPQDELAQMEKISLTENLERFASCFPTWDLHPPKR